VIGIWISNVFSVKIRKCIFCDEINEDFDDDTLDNHYWNHCPMLINCHYCQFIVEISQLKRHYLTECTQKVFRKCDRCGEPVRKEEYIKHLAKPCRRSDACPLCSNKVKSWKHHLLVEKCPLNQRNVVNDK
jgi:centrosomal protein CEP104